MPKQNEDEIKAAYPVGASATVKVRGTQEAVTVKITGYRWAGLEGTRGRSLFLETEEAREGKSPRLRSIRPAYATVQA